MLRLPIVLNYMYFVNWRGTLGSEVTLNSEGQLSYIDAGLCVLVPEAHTEVKAKDRIKFRSLYKKWWTFF